MARAPGNLGDLLRIAAERHPEEEFIVSEGRRSTFGEFNERVNRIAHGLKASGVGEGDFVASLAHNCDSLLALYFAIAKAGAVSVPLNTMLRAGDVDDVLERSSARVLVYAAEFAPLVDELRSREPLWLGLDGARGRAGLTLDELAAGQPRGEPPEAPGGAAPSTVIFTSGSTGRPKGCTKSHANQIWSAVNCQLETPRRRGDTELFTVPLAGVGFANFVLPNVIEGSRVVLTRFDAERCLELIASERVTQGFLAGTMLAAMLEVPGQEQRDLSSLRLVETAYQLSDRLREAIARRFGPIVRYCYGSTEGSNWAAPADVFLDRPDCVGFPKGLDRYRIVGADGHEVPPGTVGEVLVSGPTVMLGYLGDPQVSRDTLAGGWLHTGDLGVQDSDGMLLFRGRLKDMIKTGGMNVSAGEVEMALARHEAVAEVAVIGVPHEKWGEAVRAVVVPRADREAAALEAALHAHCREQLAGYKRPKDIVFAGELPKNPTGKLAKAEVRARFGDGAR